MWPWQGQFCLSTCLLVPESSVINVCKQQHISVCLCRQWVVLAECNPAFYVQLLKQCEAVAQDCNRQVNLKMVICNMMQLTQKCYTNVSTFCLSSKKDAQQTLRGHTLLRNGLVFCFKHDDTGSCDVHSTASQSMQTVLCFTGSVRPFKLKRMTHR